MAIPSYLGSEKLPAKKYPLKSNRQSHGGQSFCGGKSAATHQKFQQPTIEACLFTTHPGRPESKIVFAGPSIHYANPHPWAYSNKALDNQPTSRYI